MNQTANATYAGIFAGSGDLVLGSPAGAAAMTLAGANTFNGNTTISGAALVLDYTTNNNQKLGGAGGTLNVNVAALTLNGGSYTEQNAATVFAAPQTEVSRASGSSVLALALISAATGATVDFAAAGIATATSPNTSGILGGQFTVAGSDWAANSGGSIVAYSGYVPFAPSNGPSDNVFLLGSGVLGPAQQANTLKIATSGAGQSLDLSGGASGYVLSSGGLLFAGANSYTISDGSLASGTSQLTVLHNGAGQLTINSPIIDGVGQQSLIKAGSGTLALGGAIPTRVQPRS